MMDRYSYLFCCSLGGCVVWMRHRRQMFTIDQWMERETSTGGLYIHLIYPIRASDGSVKEGMVISWKHCHVQCYHILGAFLESG